MVLESLSNFKKAEKHPVMLFFVAFITTTLAMFVSYTIFPASSSILTIAFIALVFMPIMHTLFIEEEEQEVEERDTPFSFISTHFDVIHIYSWIFIGLVFTYAFWTVILPDTNTDCEGVGCNVPTKEKIFAEHNNVYSNITGKIIGETECFNSNTKSFTNCFELIFLNNSWIMILAVLFSLLWGAGALFLLSWQASVVGFFIGNEILANSLESGIARAISYLPHGIPEIMAYFVAAIAGGIISAAISKSSFKKHELGVVLVDTVLLILLAFVTLFIGAFIETAEIFGHWEIATLGVGAFGALYMVLYVPAVRYRVRKLRRHLRGKIVEEI